MLDRSSAASSLSLSFAATAVFWAACCASPRTNSANFTRRFFASALSSCWQRTQTAPSTTMGNGWSGYAAPSEYVCAASQSCRHADCPSPGRRASSLNGRASSSATASAAAASRRMRASSFAAFASRNDAASRSPSTRRVSRDAFSLRSTALFAGFSIRAAASTSSRVASSCCSSSVRVASRLTSSGRVRAVSPPKSRATSVSSATFGNGVVRFSKASRSWSSRALTFPHTAANLSSTSRPNGRNRTSVLSATYTCAADESNTLTAPSSGAQGMPSLQACSLSTPPTSIFSFAVGAPAGWSDKAFGKTGSLLPRTRHARFRIRV